MKVGIYRVQSEKTEFLVPVSTPAMYEVYFSLPHFGSVRVWHVCLLTCGTAVLTSTRLSAAMSKHIKRSKFRPQSLSALPLMFFFVFFIYLSITSSNRLQNDVTNSMMGRLSVVFVTSGLWVTGQLTSHVTRQKRAVIRKKL